MYTAIDSPTQMRLEPEEFNLPHITIYKRRLSMTGKREEAHLSSSTGKVRNKKEATTVQKMFEEAFELLAKYQTEPFPKE